MKIFAFFKAIVNFIREAITGVLKVFRSKERIKSFYQESFFRNAMYLMAGVTVLALTGFGFWFLAARLYSPEAVGFSSAVISAAGLVSTISILGLDYGLIRFLPASENKPALVGSCFTRASLVTLVSSGIFLLGLPLWSPSLLFIRENLVLLGAFIFFALATTLQLLSQATFIAYRRAGFVLAQNLIFGFLRFVPLFFFVSAFPILGALFSWELAIIIAVTGGIIFISFIQKRGLPPLVFNGKEVNLLFHFSSQNYIASLLWMLPSFILPLMVLNILGAEENAYFYIAWTIGMAMNMAGAAIANSLFAEGSNQDKIFTVDIKRSLMLTFITLVPLIIIVFFAADKILLIFGSDYSEGATVLLQLLALTSLPLTLNSIYFSKKRVEKNMKSVIFLTGAMVLAVLGSSVFLLSRYGIVSVGVVWFASHVITGLVVGRKLLK